ncbi:MAG TPA: ATP-binding protein [Polyangiaceae bacterium]|nr:ATP-binding protein [Polyangiaceae bacterium]
MTERPSEAETTLSAALAELARVRGELKQAQDEIQRLRRPAYPAPARDESSTAAVTMTINDSPELLARAAKEAACVRIAADSSPCGIMCISGPEGRYVYINQAFANLVGRSLEATLEADPYHIFLEVTHPEDVAIERVQLDRLGRGEIDSYELEKRFMSPGGKSRRVLAKVSATRDAQGRLDNLIANFTDVHDYRDAQQAREELTAQLRQSQKLEVLGRLAGGVAHDFNNRLVIIMGYTELLARRLEPENPLLEHTQTVLESAQRAAELTRQLLAYSRRQVLKPQVFDLNVTVDRMRQLLERLIGEDVELVTVLGAKNPIVSDPGQIEHVILNLAVNARDAMPDGGRLTLETRDAVIEKPDGRTSHLAAGEYVVLTVTDTGIGIPEAVVPHVFEPFFTTKEPGRGTGLGLSTAEGIVHQSGGAISVESQPGRGTRFLIHLPRAHTEAVRAAPPESTAPKSGVSFETVMVCDDDDGVRQLLAQVLLLRGYQILQARDGQHALEVARQHRSRIHLLVTDLIMPGLSGIQLAERMRALDPELRVLFISGYTEDHRELSDLLGQTTHFLPKPFLPGELTSAVCALLEQRAHAPARANP